MFGPYCAYVSEEVSRCASVSRRLGLSGDLPYSVAEESRRPLCTTVRVRFGLIRTQRVELLAFRKVRSGVLPTKRRFGLLPYYGKTCTGFPCTSKGEAKSASSTYPKVERVERSRCSPLPAPNMRHQRLFEGPLALARPDPQTSP